MLAVLSNCTKSRGVVKESRCQSLDKRPHISPSSITPSTDNNKDEDKCCMEDKVLIMDEVGGSRGRKQKEKKKTKGELGPGEGEEKADAG